MNEIKNREREQIFFEDVEIGIEIPPLIKKYNIMKMVAFSMVHGDFCPVHFDHKWAEEKANAPAPIAYGMQITAFCSQLLTDWISPNGILKKFKSSTRSPVYSCDTLLIKGKVTNKYTEIDSNYVECEFWAEKQTGILAAKGSAVVILPSKKSV